MFEEPPDSTKLLPSAPVTVFAVATPADNARILVTFEGQCDDFDEIGRRGSVAPAARGRQASGPRASRASVRRCRRGSPSPPSASSFAGGGRSCRAWMSSNSTAGGDRFKGRRVLLADRHIGGRSCSRSNTTSGPSAGLPGTQPIASKPEPIIALTWRQFVAEPVPPPTRGITFLIGVTKG